MTAATLWAWDKTNKVFRKVLVDAEGYMSIKAIVEELDDIEDVNVPTPGDDEVLYWDDAAGKWQAKAIWVAAHKDSHDPQDGSDKLDTAAPVKVGEANAIGTSHSFPRADHVHEKHHAKYTDAEAVVAAKTVKLDDLTAPDDTTDLDAAAAKHGLMPKADKVKLDAIAAGADVTADNAPQAHKDSHDGVDGSDKLDTAAPVKVGAANAIGSSHSFSRADHVHEREHAIYTDGAAVAAAEAAGLALASGKNIKLIQALAANTTWTGITAVMTAGAALALPNACYVGSDGKLELADADLATTMPVMCLVTANIAENATGEVLLLGFMRYDTWDWTPGGLIYASVTPGGLSQTAPVAAGDQVQVVGIAISADIIYFNPSFELVEISA